MPFTVCDSIAETLEKDGFLLRLRENHQSIAKHYYCLGRESMRTDLELREARIDELVRSFKDMQEAYEQLVEEREKMLKKSLRVQKVKCGLYTFIYRTKHLVEQDLSRLGYEKGDELRLVIVKTPLAKIIEKR